MPAQVRRQLRNLRSRFLDAALTEELLSGVRCFANALGWMRLRDRHEFNILRRASAFSGCVGDLRSHTLQVLPNICHEEL
jgi:hypothetical protein